MQIIMATTIGMILAFLPAPGKAIGLYLCLFVLALVLNANLFLLGLVYLFGSLLALALTAVTFQVGVLLLDGPLTGLFQGLINGPVTAWFGFEYYLVTGGTALAIVTGLILGIAVAVFLTRFRRMMANLETGSERYRKISGLWWVKLVAFIFFGGLKGKQSFSERAESGKKPLPVRPLGVIAVLTFGVIVWLGARFLDESIVTEVVRTRLERVNGATVDLESLIISPEQGQVTVRGLAMANPSDLAVNIFSADTIVADIGIGELLSRRFTLDRVEIDAARSGDERRLPGQIVIPVETRKKQPPPKKESDTTTYEDILARYPVWKDRLTKLRAWMERFEQEARTDEAAPAGETLRERLARHAELLGYAGVRADHLIAGKPLFTLSELRVGSLTAAALPDEILQVTARAISTHPNLLNDAPEITVTSESDRIRFGFTGGAISGARGPNALEFAYRGLPVAMIRGKLPEGTDFPFQEGVFDFSGTGSLEAGSISLPIRTVVRRAKVSVTGMDQPVDIRSLEIPLTIEGPLDRPRLVVERKALESVMADVLKEQGKKMITGEIEKQLGGKLPEDVDKILPGGFGGLFSGGKDKEEDDDH